MFGKHTVNKKLYSYSTSICKAQYTLFVKLRVDAEHLPFFLSLISPTYSLLVYRAIILPDHPHGQFTV